MDDKERTNNLTLSEMILYKVLNVLDENITKESLKNQLMKIMDINEKAVLKSESEEVIDDEFAMFMKL